MEASAYDSAIAETAAGSRPAAARSDQRPRLSPKRPPVEKSGLADLFPYYAGFSFDWACDQIQRELSDKSSVVLDPWNGGGTTSTAARYTGHNAVGVDLNPVANVIASLRSQPAHLLVEQSPPSSRKQSAVSPTEPLSAWFSPLTAARLRAWTSLSDDCDAANSKLILAAVFRTVRLTTRTFEGSNPTWVRYSKPDESLVRLDDDTVDAHIVGEQRKILARFSEFSAPSTPVAILTAAAQKLPLADGCVDYILTSPPYLTRIDYAVAYTRELAVLGYDIRAAYRSLRSALMGTTLIRGNQQNPLRLGVAAEKLIEDISSHQSKDSSGYYKKQVTQYLQDLASTLDEITRVANGSATMQLVVQDSYYKDVHVCLADIYREEACNRGWEFESAETFDVIRSLTSLNTSARAYTKSKVYETMLTLRRKA